MNISDVAKITQLSAKSIRLYESKSLISEPLRGENGYRQYTQKHIDELLVIARARRVGFTLEECGSLVGLSNDQQRTSAEVKSKALAKLSEVNKKIEELNEMKRQLEDWVEKCPGDSGKECPIIDDLTGCKSKAD